MITVSVLKGLKVKLSNSKLNKQKSAIQNETELSPNMIGNSNEETVFHIDYYYQLID